MQTRELYLALAKKVELYEKLYAEFTQKLCTSSLIEEAYLVGPRAHGENIPSSDFDVVVIVSGDADPIDATAKNKITEEGEHTSRHSSAEKK
ncbi:MAG: nucleotidyltransferase domain-containing protein [Desulfurococcaceae archaeon]|nr:nucleotidyltransferase domain-containing protein [Desulfurococcaceae archaeon]